MEIIVQTNIMDCQIVKSTDFPLTYKSLFRRENAILIPKIFLILLCVLRSSVFEIRYYKRSRLCLNIFFPPT